jgi:selenium metabolism protein YedF
MKSKTVDTRGQVCPKPIILTKQALKDIAIGDSLTVLIDNETSKFNVERFLKDNKLSPQISQDGTVFTLTVTKTHDAMPAQNAESYCAPAPGKRPLIVINSETMGRGAEELGTILMKAFINTIKDVDPLPEKILFYNSGIQLTTEGSPLIDPLKELEAKGTAIMSCGTCLDYYKKKDKLRVGTITNIYAILEAMAKAPHVIQP